MGILFFRYPNRVSMLCLFSFLIVGCGGGGGSSGDRPITQSSNAAPSIEKIEDQSLNEGEVLSIPVSGKDLDESDSLTFSVQGLPAFIQLTDNNDGTALLTVAPNNDDSGSYPITISISDGSLTASESFVINVNFFCDTQGNGDWYRAIHIGGNWGTNYFDAANPPEEWFRWACDNNVEWVGITISVFAETAGDSTVEPKYEGCTVACTFTDEVFRNLLRELKNRGFKTYVTLSLEVLVEGDEFSQQRKEECGTNNYPLEGSEIGHPTYYDIDNCINLDLWAWHPTHPDFESFTSEWWSTYTAQASHYANISEEEGVRIFSLGTEQDVLFRTRSDDFPNNHLGKLQTLVSSVRSVFSGDITYDMRGGALDTGYPESAEFVFQDLDLDIVGISAYFPIVEEAPTTVMTVIQLEDAWRSLFEKYLFPLKNQYPNKPMLFLEFGADDHMESPFMPSINAGTQKVFTDGDGNGLDDGEETQANLYEALFNVMEENPTILQGAFLWDNWITREETWESSYALLHGMFIRDKLVESVVKESYGKWKTQ